MTSLHFCTLLGQTNYGNRAREFLKLGIYVILICVTVSPTPDVKVVKFLHRRCKTSFLCHVWTYSDIILSVQIRFSTAEMRPRFHFGPEYFFAVETLRGSDRVWLLLDLAGSTPSGLWRLNRSRRKTGPWPCQSPAAAAKYSSSQKFTHSLFMIQQTHLFEC